MIDPQVRTSRTQNVRLPLSALQVLKDNLGHCRPAHVSFAVADHSMDLPCCRRPPHSQPPLCTPLSDSFVAFQEPFASAHACTSLTGMSITLRCGFRRQEAMQQVTRPFMYPLGAQIPEMRHGKQLVQNAASGAGDDRKTCKVGVTMCCIILCPLKCEFSILTRITNIQSACRTWVISRCLRLHRARVTPPPALGIDPTHLQARNAECPAHSVVVLGIISSPRRARLQEASLLQHSHCT